ncbi:MAG: YdeI/OmpD-associated family protein [Myxococcaceae bacterium]
MSPAKKTAFDSEQQLVFADAAAFDRWLAANHDSCPGLWLRIAKKGSAKKSVGYPEALEVALTWGWIDARKRPLDAHEWLQRFTPRGARSIWSQINCKKAEALIDAKKMKPSGLAEVERAKKDGRWQKAYASSSKAELPADFTAALDKNKKAAAFYATLNAANRYAIIYRLHSAKKPETRQKRFDAFLAMLERGEKLH